MIFDYAVVVLTILFVAIAFYPVAAFVYVGSNFDAMWHTAVMRRKKANEIALATYKHVMNDTVRRAKNRCAKKGHEFHAVGSDGKIIDASKGNLGVIVGYVCLCGAWRGL